jgi:hypothetical protein
MSAALTASASLMVFNAVNGSTSQVETLTLTDTGDAPLSLTGATVAPDPTQATNGSAQFALVNGSSLPSTLAAGASFALEVNYTASLVGIQYAVLDVASSDPAAPTTAVALHGIGTAGLGGTNQPSLMRILHAYDEPNYDDIGETDEANALYPEPPAANNDEVDLQQMVKAGPGDTAGVTGTMQQLFHTPTAESQSTYVQPIGTTSFDPGSTVFGFYDPSQTVRVNGSLVTGYTQDALNTYDTTDPRKFRFFPLENANGTPVPHSYIMTSTEWPAPIGYDFVNIVAIVTNVEAPPAPITVTAPPAQSATAGAAASFDLGTFAETGATAPYTVAVNWGDGTPDTTFTTAAAGDIPAQPHTYAAADTDTVSVTVADAAGDTSNTGTFTATVAPAPTGLAPTVTKSSLPPAVVAGLPTKGSVTVSLGNTTPGTLNGTTRLALYATTTGTVAGGTLIGSVSKRLKLKAGKSTTASVPVKPASLPAGTYTLLAEATDAPGTAIVSPTGPSLTVAAPVVTLTHTVGTVAPASLPPGRSIAFTLTLTNTGNIASAGLSTITVGLSTDGATLAVPLSTVKRSLKIAPGGKPVAVKLKVKLPATLAAGPYQPFVSFAQGKATFTAVGDTALTVS